MKANGDDGLATVTYLFPQHHPWLTPRILMPEVQEALWGAEEHAAMLRISARELAMRRHAASQEGKVINLFGGRP